MGRWGNRPDYKVGSTYTSSALQLVKSIVTFVAFVAFVALVAFVSVVHAQNQIYLEINTVMLRFVHGPGHLVLYCLKRGRTRIGQQKARRLEND